MSEIRNARIERVSLEIEDHGIFTAMIHLDYGSSAQGFGGYDLRGEYAHKFISRVFDVVGVSSWDSLRGKIIRADADFTKVYAIGNALEDNWFNPSEEWGGQP